jgi:hypothetical protein
LCVRVCVRLCMSWCTCIAIRMMRPFHCPAHTCQFILSECAWDGVCECKWVREWVRERERERRDWVTAFVRFVVCVCTTTEIWCGLGFRVWDVRLCMHHDWELMMLICLSPSCVRQGLQSEQAESWRGCDRLVICKSAQSCALQSEKGCSELKKKDAW